MEQNQLTEVTKVTIVDTEKTGTIPIIYCNQIRVVMSQWDMAIDVGQADFANITEGEKGKKNLPVDFKARIVMSPQHAKAVAKVLLGQVEQFEKKFGELTIGPRQPK